MRRKTGSRQGTALVEFLGGGVLLLLTVMGLLQLALLWAGQAATETAAHFAARKFALLARTDFRKAKDAALAEAAALCHHYPGGSADATRFTSVDVFPNGNRAVGETPRAGDAYRVLVTHGVELCVPWVNRILFALAPVNKTRAYGQYVLLLHSSRWVTVE